MSYERIPAQHATLATATAGTPMIKLLGAWRRMATMGYTALWWTQRHLKGLVQVP